MATGPEFSVSQSIEEHFDVIALGTHIPNLVSAALCARQGLRVAVLGQGNHPPTYKLGHVDAPTCLPLLSAPASELGKTVQRELSLASQFSANASLGVCSPTRRINLRGTKRQLRREIKREFPAELETWTRWMKRSEQDLKTRMSNLGAPRQNRLAAVSGWMSELRSRFDRPHAERTSQPPPAPLDGDEIWHFASALYRFSAAAHASQRKSETGWGLRGTCLCQHLQGSLVDPTRFASELLLKIERAGGTVQLGWSAKAIVSLGNGHEISLRQERRVLRCAELFVSGNLERVEKLFDEAPYALSELNQRPQTHLRFVLNAICERQCIPTVVPRQLVAYGHPQRADMHVVFKELPTGHLLVSAEQLFSLARENPSERIDRARDDVLDHLFELFPDLEQGLVLADSPHDGRPPTRYSGGNTKTSLDLWSRGPQFARRVVRETNPVLRPRALRLSPGLWALPDELMGGFGFDGAAAIATEVSRACEHHQPRRFRRRSIR